MKPMTVASTETPNGSRRGFTNCRAFAVFKQLWLSRDLAYTRVLPADCAAVRLEPEDSLAGAAISLRLAYGEPVVVVPEPETGWAAWTAADTAALNKRCWELLTEAGEWDERRMDAGVPPKPRNYARPRATREVVPAPNCWVELAMHRTPLGGFLEARARSSTTGLYLGAYGFTESTPRTAYVFRAGCDLFVEREVVAEFHETSNFFFELTNAY